MKQENIINKLKAEIIRLKSLLHGMCLDLKHAEEVRKKLVKKGDKILLCGFGVGLSAAATIMEI